MKKILFAMFAVAALASCAQDEIVGKYNQEAIGFGNAFVDNATKAPIDPSYSANDIEALTVYGTVNGGQGDVLIYDETEVLKTNPSTDEEYAYETQAWYCPVTQYWVPGAFYKFVGIVDGNKLNVTTTNLVGDMPTSISYTADGETDLLCQTITKTAKTDGTSNGLVAFNFTHLLAKAKFTVTNTTPEATNYRFTVRDIKIANAYKSADYVLATTNNTDNVWAGAWDNFASGDGQAFDTIVAGATPVESANEKLLIPGLTNIVVECVVDLHYIDGVDESLVSTTEYTVAKGKALSATVSIAAANAYDFNIEVGVGEKIDFTVVKQPEWTNVPESTITPNPIN